MDRPDAELIEQALNNPENHYIKWRKLEDGGYIAMHPLMFTIAIMTDMTVTGYANRFCFDDTARAFLEFDKIQTLDDEPTGWIARR